MVFNKFAGFFIVPVLLSAPFHAKASADTCFERAKNQAQLTACASSALQMTDDELNSLYKKIKERLQGDDQAKKSLLAAQRKWIEFRDAECEFQTNRTQGASTNAMNMNNCLADLNSDRNIQFRTYLACGDQTDEQALIECAVPRSTRQ